MALRRAGVAITSSGLLLTFSENARRVKPWYFPAAVATAVAIGVGVAFLEGDDSKEQLASEPVEVIDPDTLAGGLLSDRTAHVDGLGDLFYYNEVGDPGPHLTVNLESKLDQIVLAFSQNPKLRRLTLDSHTSTDGTKSWNMKTAQSRGDAMADYLRDKLGNDVEIVVRAFGENHPQFCPDDTPDARAGNQRVEFWLEGAEPDYSFLIHCDEDQHPDLDDDELDGLELR